MLRSKERYHKAMTVLLKKERRKRERLKELGIDYEFPGYVSSTLSCNADVNNYCDVVFLGGCFTKEVCENTI